jgi:hypothetical protein
MKNVIIPKDLYLLVCERTRMRTLSSDPLTASLGSWQQWWQIWWSHATIRHSYTSCSASIFGWVTFSDCVYGWSNISRSVVIDFETSHQRYNETDVYKLLSFHVVNIKIMVFVCSDGGYFNAVMTFPQNYPNSPPSVRFTSEMWHPNGELRGSPLWVNIIMPVSWQCLRYWILSLSWWACVHFYSSSTWWWSQWLRACKWTVDPSAHSRVSSTVSYKYFFFKYIHVKL